MNVDKKLAYITQAIAKEIETKKRQARQQMASNFDAEITKAAAQAETEANHQIQVQKQAIEKVNNRRITEAATEARRSLATLRERLTAQLFDNIRADIALFTLSPDYESFLINSIKTAQAQCDQPFAYVQLAPDDMHLSEEIQKATGLTPEPGDKNILGGFRLLTQNRSKRLEYTLASRITEARQEFATELSSLLP